LCSTCTSATGFDTLYRSDYDDAAIIRLSLDEQRIILTRDKRVLKHTVVTHGYWVRSTVPRRQLGEIVRVFDLGGDKRPFTRCILCNGPLQRVGKNAVADHLPPRVPAYFEEFAQCQECAHVYWPVLTIDACDK